MTDLINEKAEAWDLVGGLFWTKGRPTARPTSAEIDLFLLDLPPASKCAIIGASTKELVEASIGRQLAVTVIDFSEVMCADLRHAVGNSRCSIKLQDITHPIPEETLASFEAVISDRLINRLTSEETSKAFANMLAMLGPQGQIRTSVKIGLYPMDERMISEGLRRGTLSDFYDDETKTIDFLEAGPVLDDCLLPHGEIDRETLLGWYRGRRRERRFDELDVRRFAESTLVGSRRLRELACTPFPNAPATSFFVFDAVEAAAV